MPNGLKKEMGVLTLEKLDKLSWGSKISFGIGAFGKDAVYAIVSTFYMLYLTDYRGVAPAFVGTLFMVARLWDAFNDPFMGMIVDNTKTKWGKFRPWILIGTVVNAIVLAMLYLDNGLTGGAYKVWAAVFYILWGMTYTIMDIPFWSMVPALTDDDDERSQISAIPRIFASLAWAVVGSGGLAIIGILGGDDKVKGFGLFAACISVLFIICSVIQCANTKERVVVPKAEKTKFSDMGKILFKNDQVKVIIGIAFLFNVAYQLSNSFALYYFKYVAEKTYEGDGSGVLYPLYAGLASVAQVAAMLILPTFSKKIGKKVAFFFASFLPVIGFVFLMAMGYIAPTSKIAVGIASCIVNAGIGFMLVFITVILSEVVDYGEWKLGTRNESVLFSMQTFVVKFAGAFSGFVSGIGLTAIGYVANTAPSAATAMGMRVIMFVIPGVLSALCYVIYRAGYKLKGEFYEQMKTELHERRAANAGTETAE